MAEKTDNRSTGGRFEQELSHMLADAGFWVHVMQQNKAGQPADIIAVKGVYHTLIDCKVCDKGFFSFDRIEENQKMAMRMFQRKCENLCYFALKMADGSMWMISLERIETLKGRGKKRLTMDDLNGGQAWRMDNWLDSSDIWSEKS